MDPKLIDDLASRLISGLPEGFDSARQDLESNFRSVLHSALKKMDLVSREEFDVQQAVLLRTRGKLESMLERLAELEAQIKEKN